MRNIYDFGNEDISEDTNKTDKNNSANKDNKSEGNSTSKNDKSSNNAYSNDSKQQEDIKSQAKNIYDKYKDFSQDQLINELLTTSKQKLNDGSLTQTQLQNTANLLTPYLNESQKQLLNSIMERLND